MAEEQDDQWRRKIRSMLQDMPAAYPSRYAAVSKISHIVHEEIARGLGSSLLEHLKKNESSDLTARRDLMTAVNEDLRSLHLAIRCPRTQRPAILIADSKDAEHKILRYRLQVYDNVHGAVKTWTSSQLPPLELMEAQHRIENLSKPFRDSSAKGRER